MKSPHPMMFYYTEKKMQKRKTQITFFFHPSCNENETNHLDWNFASTLVPSWLLSSSSEAAATPSSGSVVSMGFSLSLFTVAIIWKYQSRLLIHQISIFMNIFAHNFPWYIYLPAIPFPQQKNINAFRWLFSIPHIVLSYGFQFLGVIQNRVPTFSDWQNSMIFPWFFKVF